MFSECGVTRAGLELGVPKHSARRPIVGTQVVRRGPHAAGQRATRRLAARHCLDRSRSAWLDRTQNTRPRGQLTGLYSRDSKIAGAPWRSCLTNVCPLRNSSSVAEGKGEAYEICGVRPDRIAAVRVPRLASASGTVVVKPVRGVPRNQARYASRRNGSNGYARLASNCRLDLSRK
jgi:hypothetical protein